MWVAVYSTLKIPLSQGIFEVQILPEAVLLPHGQALLLSVVWHLCLFVELHQWELLMLSTNESYEVI